MAKKWFQDENGGTSGMRIIAVPGAYIGMVVVVAAVVAMFFDKSNAVGLAGVGAGLVTTAMTLKWAQKNVEKN